MGFGVSLLVNVRFQVIVFVAQVRRAPDLAGMGSPPPTPSSSPLYLISNFLLGSVAENL